MSEFKLISTMSEEEYNFEEIRERSDEGHPLEVYIPNIENKKISEGKNIWERFSQFLPFRNIESSFSLGEGNTPIIKGSEKTRNFIGLNNVYFKNETQNPTWSFKDRGSFSCILMAKEMNEKNTATISTGNMGHSISAYGARASELNVFVFVPDYTPNEKINAMKIHGSNIVKVTADDFSDMKKKILKISKKLGIRMVSGNNPIRVEGYKTIAYEIFEQFEGDVPDYVAIPVSACGNIRGVFKGFRDLKRAGLIKKLPKMIVVQSENNAPIVKGLKENRDQIVPFSNFHTVAEAITSGNPYGGNEILKKAKDYNWLYESVNENEIIEAQNILGKEGLFVEAASATVIGAVKKLKKDNKIRDNEEVLMILTGSGLKDMDVFKYHKFKVDEVDISNIKSFMKKI